MLKANGTILLASLMLTSLLIARPSSYASSPKDNTIRIGFLGTLSGHAACSSQAMLQGLKLYLDKINYRIAGRPIELLVEDDEGSPVTARHKLKHLIETKKCMIIDGIVLGHIGYAVASASDRYKVPTIFAVCSADNIKQREQHPWIIRTGRNASLALHPFGEYVHNVLQYKKVACLATDDPFGYETVSGFQRTFEEQGGQVVQKIWIPFGAHEYTSYLKEIRPDADAIFVQASNSSAPAFFKQYRQQKMKVPILACESTVDESLMPGLGDECIGTYSASFYTPTLTRPQNKAFVKDYAEKYKTPPGDYAEAGYTSALCIDRAVTTVAGHAEDGARVMTALNKLQLPDAPRGPIKFDTHGNPIENIYVRKVEKVAGKLQNSVVRTYSNVSQFWKYDPVKFLAEPPYGKDNPPCRYCTAEP